MLNKIIQYSLHNRLLVMIAAIALLIWGSITAHEMEVDVFPDLNAPTVVVMTEAQEWHRKKWSASLLSP